MNDEILYTLIYTFRKNLGEQYDNNENFCGHNYSLKVITKESLTLNKAADLLEYIREVAADYGDGITNAKPIILYETKSKDVCSIELLYNYIDDKNNTEDECPECNLSENECEC